VFVNYHKRCWLISVPAYFWSKAPPKAAGNKLQHQVLLEHIVLRRVEPMRLFSRSNLHLTVHIRNTENCASSVRCRANGSKRRQIL
jgi:hypothetical protein